MLISILKTLKLKISIFLILNFIFINSQSLNSGGIGSFENNLLINWTINNNNANFFLDSNEYYYGNKSLNISLDNDVYIINNTASNFQKDSGVVYRIGFYLKGPKNKNIEVSLMNNLNVYDSTQTQQIRSSEWCFYRFQILSSSNSTTGKIQIKLTDPGNYLIDELFLNAIPGKTWYVSPNGLDNLNSNNGQSPNNTLKTIHYAVNTAWNPGDIIYVRGGEYTNMNYGTGSLDNNAVVSLNVNNSLGSLYNPLIIRNYLNETPKLKIDGSGGFVGKNSFIEISGFEISGKNQDINYQQAISNRLIQDNYYSGRGIAIWEGHHINIYNNKIHDCPNSGIRINNGDYCTIISNEVYNNTWWSSNAESAIVFATSKSIDTLMIKKMKIMNNLVYNNINKIPYYNSSYSCTGTSTYGCATQDYIIDGSGCYITRNNGGTGNDGNPNGDYNGYFYFANNVSYGNGINGLVVHKTDHAIVTNNTIFNNGEVPVVIDPNDPELWKANLSQGRQQTSGITLHSSSDVYLFNNISWARYDADFGYKIYQPSLSNNLSFSNNILAKGNSSFTTGFTLEDPLFIDTNNFDLSLSTNSPAINNGVSHIYSPPLFDFNYNKRDSLIDVGAFEYIENTASINSLNQDKLLVFPNPAKEKILLNMPFSEIKIFNIKGKLVLQKKNEQEINIKQLKKGLYIIKIMNDDHIWQCKMIKN